jgi:hypothetical protein
MCLYPVHHDSDGRLALKLYVFTAGTRQQRIDGEAEIAN